ncbi:MAG: LPS assembly lipoprotein LptE [Candidatus Acidiferrales bacterium]
MVLLVAASLAGCGYRMAGQASRLPPHVKVVAVLPFHNETTWMALEQRLTTAVMQEFIQRTRYQITSTEAGADAVLTGRVVSATTSAAVFDPATGRATAVQVTVEVAVELRDTASKQALYANPNYIFREQYEITGDLDSFFDERSTALERLARDFGATLVSAVLENF